MSPPKCRWHFPRVARIVGDIPPHDPPASAAHLSDTSGRKMELLKGGNPRTGSRVRAPPIPRCSMGGRGGFLPAFLPHLPSGKNLLLVVLQCRTKRRHLHIKKVVRPAGNNPKVSLRKANHFRPRSLAIWGGLNAVLSRGLSSHRVCKSPPAHLLCLLSLHTASAVTVKTAAA